MKRGTQGQTGLDDRRFEIHTENNDGVERVRVRGEVDLAVVGKLDSEMRRAEATEASKIELDLDQLDFLDASGVRLLLDLAQRSRRNGRRLRIRPANSPQVRRVLELTGVVEHLPLEA
jgi:anti-anti-sigma factor